MKQLLTILLFSAFCLLPLAADQALAIKAGKVHTISGPSLDNAVILVKDGIITGIGAGLEIPEKHLVLDFSDAQVYPGLINAMTSLGLSGTASLRALNDTTESGDFNPDLEAAAAFYPWSNLIPISRSHGILLALSAPAGGLVSGNAVLARLHGWQPQDMVIQRRAAMIIRFPAGPAGMMGRRTAADPETRGKKLNELLEFLRQAQVYQRQVQAGQRIKPDHRLASMAEIWTARLPVIAVADTEADIRAAIKIGKDYGLNLIIQGAYEAENCLEEIKNSGFPVIVSSMYSGNRNWDEGYDKVYRLPAALHRAGIPFAFSSSAAAGSFDLPIQAGRAVAFGLPHQEALKSLTLNPASFFGLAEHGAVAAGRRADLVITNGDILESSTLVRAVLIDGKPVRDLDYFQSEKARAAGRISGEYRE